MEKINLVELLKDCPKGMELDCTMYEGVVFDCIADEDFLPIRCLIKNSKGGYNVCHFTEYGCWSDVDSAKCVIFPKGKTSWEGFQRPFKDGDVVFYNDTISIFKEWGDETLFRTHACTYLCAEILDINVPLFGERVKREIRYATEEEKQRLFDAIKDNGYKWNAETKKLEKLVTIFKVGDKIKLKNAYAIKYDDCNTQEITEIKHSHYILDDEKAMPLSNQYLYELVPNKFDVNTLKPFDKVLVRDYDNKVWKTQFFERLNNVLKDRFVCMGGNRFHQCIPYEGNEHLLNTSNEPNDIYKIW